MKISTGSHDLNKWLEGGYDADIITTLYGPGGSGKTNLCMMTAASQAKNNNKIIFVDTEGGFSIERFKQLTEQEADEALKNIILLKPTSFFEQDQAFSRLLREIKTGKIKLIIIDSMTMLYRLELAEAEQDGIKKINSKLARQMRILSEISRRRQIPILMTNQVYSDFLTAEQREQGIQAGVRMVGGDILKYWSKCIIELQNLRKGKKAILRKHRSLSEREISFEITNLGLKKKGIF